MPAQRFGRHGLPLVLRLKQHDGAHVLRARRFVLQRRGLQRALRLHGAKHRLRPAFGVLGQGNRQLDHAFGRQLLRADVVEHVGARRNRRGRQLQQTRGVQPLERGKALVRLGVVRLIDDDDGPLQRQPVRQALARLADKAAQQGAAILRRFFRGDQGIGQVAQRRQIAWMLAFHRLEMPLKAFRKAVHVSLVGVVDAKTLDGGDHHHGRAPPVRRGNLRQFIERHHAQRIAIGIGQRLAIRVARRLQRRERLRAYRLAGHQPHRHWRVAGAPVAGQQRHRMRRQQRLAPAGGNAQAHARHIRPERVGVVRPPCQLAKRQRRALDLRGLGEGREGVEGGLLVGLEGQRGHVAVCNWGLVGNAIRL